MNEARYPSVKQIRLPCRELPALAIGDQLELSGEILCGRDAVLPRIVDCIQNDTLPDCIDLAGTAVFHTAVSRAGVGPTSSNKLDIEDSIPTLSAAGVVLHLGKGKLREDTVETLRQNRSFFAVVPPTSALLESCILSKELVAFGELGMEALYRIRVERFPAIVAIADGKSLFSSEGE